MSAILICCAKGYMYEKIIFVHGFCVEDRALIITRHTFRYAAQIRYWKYAFQKAITVDIPFKTNLFIHNSCKTFARIDYA